HMQKHGAAPAGNPGPGVVVDLDQEVVEPILAPEPVAWLIGRAPEWLIVPAAAGVFAPGHAGGDAGRGQQGCRFRATIGAPPQPPQTELAPWRGAVTFTLVGANPGAAQYHRDGQPPRDQHPAAALTWPGGNPEN